MVATYFPLAFVYSLSTWAVWVLWSIGYSSHRSKHVWWLIQGVSLLGVVLYGLANLSYTIAVFTDPGSPLESARGSSNTRQATYSVLPTTEPIDGVTGVQNITVSSTGAPRYCKKCHTSKPDRTHHCSTCQRCVLKMDHHCPWLSTCLGLHNYKAFVLFLIYISLFSWACFANAAWWLWKELFEQSGYLDEMAPVNTILLAVVSGIIGLVITGFTGWHLYLCVQGQTTIEKLEKTRYLSGVRSRVERNRQDQQMNHHRRTSEGVAGRLQRAGEQILEFHANAVPGASRYEEGEEHTSPVPSVYQSHPQYAKPYPQGDQSRMNNDTPALQALRRTYSNIEAQRERDRYAEYLDDHESSAIPSAFDLGWRRNLSHLFGPSPLLWWLPVCNTTGNGWNWEVSEKWHLAVEDAGKRKERRLQAMMNQPGTGMRGESDPRMYDGYERDREHYNGHDEENLGLHYEQRTGDRRPYSQSAMSMKPLPHQRRHRADFDQAEPDGQIEAFQVSSSDDSDDDSDSDIGYDDAERGWERRNRGRRLRATR